MSKRNGVGMWTKGPKIEVPDRIVFMNGFILEFPQDKPTEIERFRGLDEANFDVWE